MLTERYDRKMEDIFTVQDDISASIVTRLKLKLLPEQVVLPKRQTENAEAYRLYLHGLYYWNKRTEPGFKKALNYFERAIAADPAYAVAYAGIADCYALLGIAEYGTMLPRHAMPKAKAAATRALELDPRRVEAQTQLAHVTAFYDWNWPEAEKGFKRAIGINPAYPFVHHWYALFLAAMERFEEAIAEEHRALELDPLSMIINKNVGTMYYYARRYDQAIEQYRRAIELAPEFARTHFYLAIAYLAEGSKSMLGEAIRELEKAIEIAGPNSVLLAALGHTYGRAGRTDQALGLLNQLQARATQQYIPALNHALIYIGLGIENEALNWLEKAVEERCSWLVSLKVEPLFDSLRSHPHFSILTKRIGLVSK